MAARDKKLTIKELKSRTEGNEMDLSLMGIVKVPVKEIGAVAKVNTVDLSCNRIPVLPDNFCNMLSYLVKLDLSKNLLSELPDDFGKLKKLQHLDLYHNKIKVLPVSFCHLLNLQWLDLKDNPLEENFAKIVGDCLDDKQCKHCAVKVVAAMKTISSNQERERQKSLKAQREQQAAEKLEDEKKAKIRKQQKKLEKEQKRREWEAQQKRNLAAAAETLHSETSDERIKDKGEASKTALEPRSNGRNGFCGLFFFLLVAVFAVAVGIYFYCDDKALRNEQCQTFNRQIAKLSSSVQYYSKVTTERASELSEVAVEKLTEVKLWVAEQASRIRLSKNSNEEIVL